MLPLLTNVDFNFISIIACSYFKSTFLFHKIRGISEPPLRVSASQKGLQVFMESEIKNLLCAV
jgi:hypothetical protein